MARALVLGSSSGIGREVAYVLARKGYHVYCAARDIDELVRIAADIKIRYGETVVPIEFDLEDRETIRDLSRLSPLMDTAFDCAVIAAGTMPSDDVVGFDPDALQRTTFVNYTGIAIVIDQIAHRMANNGGGVIVCLSSVAGERGRYANFVYGASKAALNAYLQGLRARFYKKNVRVITVMPGYVDTLMAYGRASKRLTASPQYVAERVCDLVDSRRNVVYIPWPWRYVMLIIKMIPESIFKKLKI